jgi:hypothetical protein
MNGENGDDLRVIKIDPAGRYVFVLPRSATMDEANDLFDYVKEWWDSDKAVMVVRGIELVRVDGEEETEETET